MLGRLGLVIHWAGFLSFFPIALYLIITEPRETIKFIDNPELYFPSVSETQAFNSWVEIVNLYGQESDEANAALAELPTPVLQGMANRNLSLMDFGQPKSLKVLDVAGFGFLLSILTVASLLTSWLINFILSGHKSPLPWVANKETNND
jgi:hypothetical protein